MEFVSFGCVSFLSGMLNVEMKKTENLEEFIHGLSPHTNYSVRVSAYTSAGDGVESDRYYCCTEEDGEFPFI